MIEMKDLYAGYGRKRTVLRGLGGTIAEGHIYGLLVPTAAARPLS